MTNKKKLIEYSGPFIEGLIRVQPKLHVYMTGKQYSDFKLGDPVKCTYLKGIYKIVDINEKKGITLQHIDSTKIYNSVSPNFLIKIKINDKSIKVLFE